MRNLPTFKAAPILALAAVLALLAPAAPLAQAASRRSNAELLSSQLPGGETLTSAPMKDLRAAVKSAVAKRPADAADIVRIAILAKKGRREHPRCEDVRVIVDAAMAVAPDRAREISEMAQTVAPDCSAEIAEAVRGISTGATSANAANASGATLGTNPDGTDVTTGAVGGGDFGGGFGPGFPGSPNFGGSSPSGGFAQTPVGPLPTPATGSTTTVTNN